MSSSDLSSWDSFKGETESLVMEDCTLGGTPLYDIYISCNKRQRPFVNDPICVRLQRFYSVNMSPRFRNTSEDNLRAAKSSKLAVIMLSNEFFLSKNNMVELSAIFDAGVKILPIFFELSPQDLSNKKKIQKWLMRWEKFVSEDSSINVHLWGHALQRLQSVTAFVLNRSGAIIMSPFREHSDLSEIIQIIVPTFVESVQILSLEEALKKVLQSAIDNIISKKCKVKVPSEVALTTLKNRPSANHEFQRSYRLLSSLHPESLRRQILVELERHNFSLELGSPEIEVQKLYNLLNTNDRRTCFVLSGDHHSALVNCVELLYKASLTKTSLVTTDLGALLNWLKDFALQADRTTTHDAVQRSGIEHLLAFWMKPVRLGSNQTSAFSRVSFNGTNFAVDYPREESFFNLPTFNKDLFLPPKTHWKAYVGHKLKLKANRFIKPLIPKLFSDDNSKEEAKHLSMPLSPKMKNKDIQEHSSEISDHDQRTSSCLTEIDPNFILREFDLTYSSESSDHDQTTSSHLPESGTKYLVVDGINSKGVWIRFELNGQNPQIIVGAQYLNVLDTIEFFFESPEDMAACVGVGLSQSMVILDENLTVTIQQLESDEWNSSEKSNGKLKFSDRDFDLIIPINMSSQQDKKQVYANAETSESSARKYGVGFDGIWQYRSCETYGGSQDEDFCPLLYEMALFALNKLAIRQHADYVAATRDNPAKSSESSSSSNNSKMRQNLSDRCKQENGQEADGKDQGGDEGSGGEEKYTIANGRGNVTPSDMNLIVHVLPLPNCKVYCPRRGTLVDCSTIGYHLECASIEPELVLVFSRKQGEKTISINAMSRLALETNSSVYEDPILFHWYHDRISILLGCADTQRAAYLEPYSTKIYGGEETVGGTHSISSTTSSTFENIQVKTNQMSGKIKVGGVLEVGAQGSSSASKNEGKARNSTENYEEPTKDVCNGFKYEDHSRLALAKFELSYPQLEDNIGDINKTSLHGKGLFSTITPKIEGIWRPLNEEESSPYMLKIDRSLKVHRKKEPRLDIKQDYVLSFYVNHAMTHLDQRKKKNSKEEIWLIEQYSKPPPNLPGVIDNLSSLYNE